MTSFSNDFINKGVKATGLKLLRALGWLLMATGTTWTATIKTEPSAEKGTDGKCSLKEEPVVVLLQ